MISSRLNFYPTVKDWLTSFLCYRPMGRSDQFLRKGRRKIELDLDLRTYLKSVRDHKLL